MKILVVDRDTLATQMIKSKLEARGHAVVLEPVKNNAIERLGKERFETVFFDPAPLNNARPIVLGVRRSARMFTYVVLMSSDMDENEALRSGANDMLKKPLDASQLDRITANSARLLELIARIGDEREDFPSAGGVIAKSAFNQLFLSSLDRADRYGERSYLVFIGIRNYQEIVDMDGAYAAEYAAAKLSQYLVRLRRQSDIIAQTGKSEYCLMLQRPVYETEPMEAAKRFAEALGKLEDICISERSCVEVYVRLIEIPLGTALFEHILTYDRHSAPGAAGRG